MSSIDRLQIQGIRSFGPEKNDVAVIKFYSPLTLILGQNGCGKTTIIESLKYATCGELPAGTDGGSGFVHDPELANSHTVRGQVKLRCSDIRGNTCTVVRTVQVIRKAKKLEFKSLDSTVTTNEGSISGRCADIDALMCNSLGITKPVLTNVVFCHQEDSAWPLEKGKKIKERFDAIFGIIEYNKCLDYLRQIVKEKNISKDKMKIAVEYKKKFWNDAIEKRKRLDNTKVQLGAIHDQLVNLDSRIEPINVKTKDLLQKELNLVNHMSKVKDKKNRKQLIFETLASIKKNIQTAFEGTKEELIFKIETFEQELNENQNKLSILIEQKQEIISKEKLLQKDISVKQMQLGTLQSNDQQNNERIDTRNMNLRNLAEQLGLPIVSNSQLNETNGEDLLKSIEIKIKEYNKQLDKLQEEQENIEKSLQNKIDSCREKKIKLELDISTKKKTLENNKREMQKVTADIIEVDKSTETLGNLERNLEDINKELNVLIDSLNINQCKKTIEENTKTVNSLEEKLSSLNQEIKTLQQISIEKSNLERLEERKRTQENEFNTLKKKHDSSLKHLLFEIPQSNFKSKLDTCIQKITDDIRNIEKLINNDERELSALTEKKKSLDEQIRAKNVKVSQDTEKIEECCGQLSINDYIGKLNTEIDDVQVRKGTLNASECLFNRYIKNLEMNPLCPLCRREFNEDSEVKKLTDELKGRLQKMPVELERVENELSNITKRHETALQLKPLHEQINIMCTEELPRFRTESKNIATQIETVRSRIEENRLQLMGPQSDETVAKSLLSDTTLMDQYQREIQTTDREIVKLESKFPILTSARTLQEANDEQDELRTQLSNIRKTLESDQKKLSIYNEKFNKLSEEKNKLTALQLKIAGGVQQRKSLIEKLSELQKLETVLTSELRTAENRLNPVSEELENFIKELHQAKISHKKLLQARKDTINEYEKNIDEIKKLQNAIVNFNKKGGKHLLNQTRKELTQFQLDKDDLSTRKNKLEKEIENINQFRNRHQLEKLNLDNNLQLRNKKEELLKIEQEIKELEGTTEIIDVDQLQTEKNRLSEQKKALEKEKSHAEGRQEELLRTIKEFEYELNKDEYRNAEDEYRKSYVEFTVTAKAIDDLKEYEKAMDWVMIHFHKDRMKMINNIIRELWRAIYRGNDIDSIEIKTDESSSTSAGEKNYNYKVIQIKNGVELDMPGRCSAGQKVLACLIIRMALAETFSKNCGIFALDEPTTNLDKENIESLSQALAEIVERRLVQRNFQLIIITHDEEFLKRLFTVEKVEKYLEVKRDNRGKSKIKINDV
ncbi:hypothetical protein PGB90_004978 [Kerria lacca]